MLTRLVVMIGLGFGARVKGVFVCVNSGRCV